MPEKRRCEVERYRDAVMQSSSEEAETFREGVDSQKNRIGCACVQIVIQYITFIQFINYIYRLLEFIRCIHKFVVHTT